MADARHFQQSVSRRVAWNCAALHEKRVHAVEYDRESRGEFSEHTCLPARVNAKHCENRAWQLNDFRSPFVASTDEMRAVKAAPRLVAVLFGLATLLVFETSAFGDVGAQTKTNPGAPGAVVVAIICYLARKEPIG